MDSRRLAQLAYGEIIDQIAKLQQEMALQAMVKNLFGGTALPVNSAYRSDKRVIADAPAKIEREMKYAEERITEFRKMAVVMEEVFKADSDESMEAFAAHIAERLRKARAT